jgi:hypothetical protein
MRHLPNLGLVLTSAALLGACSGHYGPANPKICATFHKPAANAPAPGDAAAPTDLCVKRWAYSLASAHDEAATVGDAAVAACGSELSAWNQAAPDQTLQDSTGAPVQTLSLDTGLPTNAVAEHAAFARRRALLYVVEARAGRCNPPPVVKGAPAGG